MTASAERVAPAASRKQGLIAALAAAAIACHLLLRLAPPVGPIRPGGAMPTVIGHHDVKDTDHWLASPKREEVFGPLGVTNIRTFVDP